MKKFEFYKEHDKIGDWIYSMVKVTDVLANYFKVDNLGNVLSEDIPTNKIFIHLSKVSELTGITEVAYCSNLLCFCLFREGNTSVYCVSQSAIHSASGMEGFLKLTEGRKVS